MLRVALYARVSDSDAQAGRDKASIPAQQEESRQRAQEVLGDAIFLDPYVDDRAYRAGGRMAEPGGERADRPAYQRLIADGYAQKYDYVAAWKEDRLYRGVRAAVVFGDMLEKTGIRVILARESFDVKMLYIKAAIGKIELDNIKDRLRMGQTGRAKRGLHHGGRLCYGYRAVKDGDGRTAGYAIDPTWQDWFGELARLFVAKVSYRNITLQLARPPGLNVQFYSTAIVRLIRNPWYRGLVLHRGQLLIGKHPKMWDDKTCAAIERELERRRDLPSGTPRKGEAVFTGILHCGLCDSRMCIYSTTRLKNGQKRRAYGCSTYEAGRRGDRPGPSPHKANYISEARILAQLREMLSGLTPEMINAYVLTLGMPTTPHLSQRGRVLRAEIEDLDRQAAEMDQSVQVVAFPSAREALVAEMRKIQGRAGRLRTEVDGLENGAEEIVGEELEAAMQQLVGDPTVFDLPLAELRTVIQSAIPALYAAGGKISLSPMGSL